MLSGERTSVKVSQVSSPLGGYRDTGTMRAGWGKHHAAR
jgi:hypothetical protein